MTDQEWMTHALLLADKAQSEGEVPVGAVVVRDDELVSEGWNRNIALHDPSAHAEIMALQGAGQKLNNHRLPGCVLYVTLEPCCMCAGAMIHARLARVVYGASDPKTGAAGSRFNVLTDTAHNHRLEVSGGCLEANCSAQLRQFFKAKRKSIAND